MREGQFLPLLIFALTDDAWSGRPSTWPVISGTWDYGGDYREVLGAGRHRQPDGTLFPGRELRCRRGGQDLHRRADKADLLAEELDRQVVYKEV
jgi:hypothetical protein